MSILKRGKEQKSSVRETVWRFELEPLPERETVLVLPLGSRFLKAMVLPKNVPKGMPIDPNKKVIALLFLVYPQRETIKRKFLTKWMGADVSDLPHPEGRVGYLDTVYVEPKGLLLNIFECGIYYQSPHQHKTEHDTVRPDSNTPGTRSPSKESESGVECNH
jgi:hypothetical protein